MDGGGRRLEYEKVIKGLECCIGDTVGENCSECPYETEVYVKEDGTYELGNCMNALLRDALVLLKAQNAADNLDAAIRLVQKVTEDVRKNYE